MAVEGPAVSDACVCVSWGLSVIMASTIHPSIHLSSTQRIYPRWLLKLHAPVAHFLEPVAAVLWVGNQVQVPQEQLAKTSYTRRPLCPEMNLILCPSDNVSSLWYPKTGTEPHSKTALQSPTQNQPEPQTQDQPGSLILR